MTLQRALRCLAPCLLFIASGLPAQDEGEKEPNDPAGRFDPFDKMIDLRAVKYVPPARPNAPQGVELTFNVSPDVPLGTKITFQLQYKFLPYESTFWTLKNNQRRNIKFLWQPKKKLALDTYIIVVHINPDEQTPKVKAAIRRKPKKFPPRYKPWTWNYYDTPLEAGTKAERKAEREATCDAFNKHIDKLIKNYLEFKKLVTAVKEGKELVNGSSLDEKAFTKRVVAWRKKQGEAQKGIIDMQIKRQALVQKNSKAYRYLLRLSRMTSKMAIRLQREVTTQYGTEIINPPSHKYFASNYRYRVGEKQLNGTLDTILDLVCPPPEEEQGKDGGKGKDSKKDGKSGKDAVKGADGKEKKPEKGKSKSAKEKSESETAN